MDNGSRDWGALAAMLLFVSALGVNWLITPASHPDASTLNFLGAWIQFVGCGLGAIWAWRRARSTGGGTDGSLRGGSGS